MSTLTIQMPESLARQLQACADDEGVTVDQLLASAAAGKRFRFMSRHDPQATLRQIQDAELRHSLRSPLKKYKPGHFAALAT